MNNAKIKQTNQTALLAPLTDESGAVLIITVIILLLLTLIGVSGINTASTDIQITSNYRIHNLNVTCADAAVNRAKSLIAYGNATTSDPWVNDITDLYNAGSQYFNNGTGWDQANTPVRNEIAVDQVIAVWDNGKINVIPAIPNIPAITPTTMPGDADVEFVVYINTKHPQGNSVVIARSRKNGGDVIIEAAFNQE